MRALFDPRSGLGLSYLRQPMGASDFVAGPHYTYDDVPAGPDRLPPEALLDRPRPRRDPAAAAPGAAPQPGPEGHGHAVEPARVDEDQRLAGRRALQGRPARLRRLRALLRALRPGLPARRRPDRRRHAAERAPEPQPERLSGHGPARRRGGAAGRRGRPRAASAPASTRRSSATTTTGRCTPTTSGRPTIRPTRSTRRRCSSNPAASHYLAGTAFHCYSGDPERQSILHDAFPQKDIYFTECSGSLSGDPATTFPDTLHWHTRFLTVGAVRNWAKTVITWNLALDPVRRSAQRRLRHVLRRRHRSTRPPATRRRPPTTTSSGT